MLLFSHSQDKQHCYCNDSCKHKLKHVIILDKNMCLEDAKLFSYRLTDHYMQY